MFFSISIKLLTLATSLLTVASGATIRDSDLLPSYDYIIVGGGTSGLVLASRLSADPSTTVLVIESGPLLRGSDEDFVLYPGYIGQTGLRYQWNVTSEPMPSLNNRTILCPSARVVGGGTAINGMFFDRGSARDYDDWATLLDDKSWGWQSLFQCFKKSTTFRPPPEGSHVVAEQGVTWDASAYGTTGPVQAGFPDYIAPYVKPIRAALQGLGVAMPVEAAKGDSVGALWVPNSLDTRSMTRSYSKTAYYDPIASRENLHLLVETTVTRLLFGRTKRQAVGVNYAADAASRVSAVKAEKEVILAAGAVHTPQLLQLSGIGDARHLKSHGIPVLVDLPGVGQNLQDHAVYSLAYNNTLPAEMDPAEALALYLHNRTGPFTASAGSFGAFLSLPTISNRSRTLVAAADADGATHLAADTHPHVAAGWLAHKRLLLRSAVRRSDWAIAEFIGSLTSLQHPLSRGSVTLRSASIWDSVVVDWRTLTHPFDVAVLTDAARYVRHTLTRPEVADLNSGELSPGPSVSADAEWEAELRRAAGPTFAHPSCTTPMGRRDQGGVVDAQLRVYGVRGLRIVDAGVMPLVPATHLSSTVYAVAERAAAIIAGKSFGC